MIKYGKEFSDKTRVQESAKKLASEVNPEKNYNFMEFCGGHTHVLFRYGLLDLLPKNIHMIHGPGCPVCVLPMSRIDGILDYLEKNPATVLFTYGDVLRVPGSAGKSLLKAKAAGAQIKMTYSSLTALEFAQANPTTKVIFLAVGFETTTPPTAQVLLMAKEQKVKNFFVCCYHVLTPPAIEHILASSSNEETNATEKVFLDGIVGPGHVSIITGSKIYQQFIEKYQKPLVIAGFYPLDMLQALIMLVKQANKQEAQLENQYQRTVTPTGNLKAQKFMETVFTLRDSFEWRGLGTIPKSALKINEDYSEFDAELQFGIEPNLAAKDHPLCECGAILRGIKSPKDCKIFGKLCTPETPLGACMVSSEGACAAYYTYGQDRA